MNFERKRESIKHQREACGEALEARLTAFYTRQMNGGLNGGINGDYKIE